MRKEFVSADDTRITLDVVKHRHPWAATVIQVADGWHVFESAQEADDSGLESAPIGKPFLR